jgi:hypothetical protein
LGFSQGDNTKKWHEQVAPFPGDENLKASLIYALRRLSGSRKTTRDKIFNGRSTHFYKA